MSSDEDFQIGYGEVNYPSRPPARDAEIVGVPHGTGSIRVSYMPQSWGRHGWMFLHAIAKGYPEDPSLEDMVRIAVFLCNLAFLLPCEKCRMNWTLKLHDRFSVNCLLSPDHLQKFIIEARVDVDGRSKTQPGWRESEIVKLEDEFGVNSKRMQAVDIWYNTDINQKRLRKFDVEYIRPYLPALHPKVEEFGRNHLPKNKRKPISDASYQQNLQKESSKSGISPGWFVLGSLLIGGTSFYLYDKSRKQNRK